MRHRFALLPATTMATIVSCVLAFSATSASAEGTIDTADPSTVAALVADATPDNAQAVDPSSTASGFTTSTADATTSIPNNPEEPIEVVADTGGREISASIILPNGLDLASAEAAENGTVVYPSENDASVAVQTLESGDTRVQTVIPNREATHEATFGMEGFRAVIDASGQAGFLQKGREGVYVPVEAPWATDAVGETVPTHYETRGEKLVQVVSPTSHTVYPIVADPTWGWRNAAWGLTLSRTETARIKDYAAASASTPLVTLMLGAPLCMI